MKNFNTRITANYNGWNLQSFDNLYTEKPDDRSPIVDEQNYSNVPFCFVCEHCHKLVLVSNPSKYVGHTLRCECGHMHTIVMHTFFIDHGYNPYYDDYGNCTKIIAPEVVEINIPKRQVFETTCLPIILTSGDHFVGTNSMADVDVKYMLQNLVSNDQFSIIVRTRTLYSNARDLVEVFKNYDAAIKKAQAEKKAARIKKIMSPWNTCCKAIGNFFLSISNIGN